MKILISNDDGYKAEGIQALVRVLRKFGDLTIVAPKTAQSGMSMAVNLGFKPLAYKHIEQKPGEDWWYLDATPSSCIKFGLDNVLYPERPDLVVSGVNHGSNSATASLYSGTIGAAMEGAVNGIPGIAVSLDNWHDDADFSIVEEILPGILEKLIPNMSGRFGTLYNINFPAIKASEVKGVKASSMGLAHWEKEYQPYCAQSLAPFGHEPSGNDLRYIQNLEPGEDVVVMVGNFTDDPNNPADADHRLVSEGYVVITPLNLNNTDQSEKERLCAIF